MRDRKLEITQTGKPLHHGAGRRCVLFSDKDGAAVSHQWWLNPAVLNLPGELKNWGCSDAQIRQAATQNIYIEVFDDSLRQAAENFKISLPEKVAKK